MPPDKDKRFTEDFVRKWSRAGASKPKQASKSERILKNQQEILKKDPRNHKIWFARGILLAEMGRFKEASRCFDAVIKLDPKNKAVYNSKASALLQMGEIEQSSEWYRRALDISSVEIAPDFRATLAERLPVKEVIREMIEESREWEEIIRTRACPICGSGVLWDAKICPTCEWEFHDEDFKELTAEMEVVRPDRELTEGELRERLIHKIEDYRLEGYEVGPIVRTMKTEPHRARSAVDQFEENVAEIKEFKKTLESRDTTGFEMKLKEMDQLFRSPYNMFAIRKEYDKLIKRIEAREAKRTARPRVPIERRPAAVGLTNGMKGRVNGLGKERGVGLTNGRRGRVNGMVNGRGRVNGLTNGLGRVNGMTNGVGRVNGMVSGRGRVNGVTDGLVYRFQTMKTGLVNGITNGNGMTNGLGSIRFRNESKIKKWKLAIIPIVAFLLLTTPFFIFVEVPVSDIVVDGDFGDWSGVQKIASSRDLSLPRNVDVINVAARNDNKYLSLYAEVDNIALFGNPATQVPDTIHFLLDVDDDAATGYLVRGIGADFMIEVKGHGGNVLASVLYKFSSETDQNNWSAWDAAGHPQADVATKMLETQVPYKDLGANGDKVSVLVHTRSYDGYSDFSEHIISDEDGVLVVSQFWSDDAKVLAGTGNVILTLNIRALGSRMKLSSLTAYLTGDAEPTEIDRIRLTADGEEVDAINTLQSSKLTFTFKTLVVDEDDTVVMSLDATITSSTGNTLGAKVSFSSDFELSSGVASLSDAFPSGSMDYVGQVDTDNVEIDGGFSDWNGVETDQDNDTIENPNIDINGFASKMVPRSFPSIRVDAFFYVNVAGRIAGGSLVPYASPGPLRQLVPARDSDRDTVPDAVDIFPLDFNNDGTPDADTNFDVDGDTVLDYPSGPDYYLETTIPISFPPPYGGREVRIFNGPRIAPEVTGEDYLRAYVDIDGDVRGYAVGPVYADYLLEIRGKNGEINSISFLEFDGADLTDWEWTATGKEVAASLDKQRIEAFADITLLGGDRFEVLFEATDWEEMQDRATNISGGGRSATRGSFGEYGARFSSGSYDAYLTDLADKASFNRRDNQLSWTLPREIRWDDGTDFEVLGELIPSSLLLERDGVTYSDAYSNLEVSIEYIFEENGLKENIILEREIEDIGERGDLSFLSPLQYTDGLMIQANGVETGEWTAIEGGLTFKERDTTAFHIASPYSIDSSGDVLDCYYLYSSTEQLLDLRCPTNWFATASYPVFIDPSVYTLENDDATLGQAEEYLGWSVAIGDFDDDSYADIATGAPYADVGANEDAGAVYIYYGPFSGDDTSPDVTITASITGAHLGWAIAAGIFNNDDYWDLIVTQLNDDAYAYYGSSSWSGSETTPDVTFDLSAFEESGDTENFGNAVAVGNFDYNVFEPLNFDDVAFGANLSDIPGNGNHQDGMAFIFYGGFGATETGEDAKIAPEEHSNDGEFATSLASGKIDDDDKWDIVAGEPMNNTDDGTVHIYFGKNLGSLGNFEYDDAYLDFESSGEMFGLSVAVGDMDSDTYADILVGAPGNDEQGTDAGRAYVYQANTDGTGITDIAAPDQDLTWSASNAGAELGYSVAVGDFEGDDVGDAIVGARYDDAGGALRGSILIYDNPIATDGSADYTVSGSDNNETLGWSVTAGNFSGDTFLVIASGAPFWNDSSPSENEAGRVMVIIIPETLDIILVVPLLFAIPIAIRRRKRKSLQFGRDRAHF